jgi:hypothetical protein
MAVDNSSSAACLNCGTTVVDNFCPACGQSRSEHLVSMKALLRDFFDDQFSVNARLPRTLYSLFLQPGVLTREYFDGRIARYVRPFRLFLVASLVFFIAVSFMISSGRAYAAAEQRAGISLEEIRAAEARGATVTRTTVNFGVDTATSRFPALARRLQAQEERINALPSDEAFRAFATGVAEAAARMAFLLAPGFAMLLKLLHLLRRRLYAEHFVFALHFHAVAFAALTLALLLGQLIIWLLAVAYLVVYLVIALRTAYRQPWFLAAAKVLVLVLVYSAIVTTGAVLAILLGAFIA